MKKRAFKFICLLLALCLMLTPLFSCKKDGEGSEDETTVSTTYGRGSNNKDDKLYERLPTGDYGGYEFTMLNCRSNYAFTDIVPEVSEDSLSAALFERNSVVNEKLNIKLVEEPVAFPAYSAILDQVRKLNQTQSIDYDAIFNEVAWQTPLAQEGAYLAVEDYEAYLDLNNPWWFNDAMDSLKIGGTTYELFGDFHLMYYESIYGMAFNQEKFENAKVEFPYDLVREEKWTIAKLKEMLADIDASSDEENHYGITSMKEFSTCMITSWDFRLIEQDDAELLVPYADDETLVEIYETLFDFYVSNGDGKQNWIDPSHNSAIFKSGAFNGERDGTAYPSATIFADGRSAFIADAVGAIRSVRTSEFDYGIVPTPKYNEDQGKYVNYVYSGAASCGIPASTPDLERTCTVLQNLSAYSYKHVKDEYYEIVVQLRTVRDNDSIEMLDIVFGHSDMSTTRFELDVVYDIGIFECVRVNLSDGHAEVKSQLDSIKLSTVPTKIADVIKAYGG